MVFFFLHLIVNGNGYKNWQPMGYMLYSDISAVAIAFKNKQETSRGDSRIRYLSMNANYLC